jgi:hypothetical protein
MVLLEKEKKTEDKGHYWFNCSLDLFDSSSIREKHGETTFIDKLA